MCCSRSLILLLLFMTGCGSARRGVPLYGPMEMKDSDAVRGEQVFMSHCNSCHPRGEAGIGFALNNKWLPDWAIRTQVRVGVGAMPGFSEEIISDRELEDIIAYLDYMRDRKP
ncbi:MAG: cytochrome c [Syntrophotaleaceae bacterium]